jgi:hypothetical protein
MYSELEAEDPEPEFQSVYRVGDVRKAWDGFIRRTNNSLKHTSEHERGMRPTAQPAKGPYVQAGDGGAKAEEVEFGRNAGFNFVENVLGVQNVYVQAVNRQRSALKHRTDVVVVMNQFWASVHGVVTTADSVMEQGQVVMPVPRAARPLPNPASLRHGQVCTGSVCVCVCVQYALLLCVHTASGVCLPSMSCLYRPPSTPTV